MSRRQPKRQQPDPAHAHPKPKGYQAPTPKASCADPAHAAGMALLQELHETHLATVWHRDGAIMRWTVGVDLELLVRIEQLLQDPPRAGRASRPKQVRELADPYAP